MRPPLPKSLVFLGGTRDDLRTLPEVPRRAIGAALFLVQIGETPSLAKPLRGFGGASVLEIVEDYRTDTYRAVYTVRFARLVYVLHVFQKKSRHGRATPQRDSDLISRRLQQAEAHYRTWLRDHGDVSEGGG